MCCAEFIAKYVLIIANLVFSLFGLVIVGLGITVSIYLKDLDEILPLSALYISAIVLGVVVFLIGFLACCGAIKESRCMLICYAIAVGLILVASVYLTTVVFGFLDTAQETVDGWIVSAFNTENLRPVFNTMETTFRCCGTIGSQSYTITGQAIPPSCCSGAAACDAAAAYRGCGSMVGDWFTSFGGAVAGVLIVVIIIEAVAVVLALFFSHSIKNKSRGNAY